MYLKSLRIKEKNVTFAPKVCEIFKHIHIVGVLKKNVFPINNFWPQFFASCTFSGSEMCSPLAHVCQKIGQLLINIRATIDNRNAIKKQDIRKS